MTGKDIHRLGWLSAAGAVGGAVLIIPMVLNLIIGSPTHRAEDFIFILVDVAWSLSTGVVGWGLLKSQGSRD